MTDKRQHAIDCPSCGLTLTVNDTDVARAKEYLGDVAVPHCNCGQVLKVDRTTGDLLENVGNVDEMV